MELLMHKVLKTAAGVIAVRLYQDIQEWRDIAKVKPGLDPRRLRIGEVIKLPKPVSEG